MAFDKTKDRRLAHRAQLGSRAWSSSSDGTFNEGRNAAKRERRAAKKRSQSTERKS